MPLLNNIVVFNSTSVLVLPPIMMHHDALASEHRFKATILVLVVLVLMAVLRLGFEPAVPGQPRPQDAKTLASSHCHWQWHWQARALAESESDSESPGHCHWQCQCLLVVLRVCLGVLQCQCGSSSCRSRVTTFRVGPGRSADLRV